MPNATTDASIAVSSSGASGGGAGGMPAVAAGRGVADADLTPEQLAKRERNRESRLRKRTAQTAGAGPSNSDSNADAGNHNEQNKVLLSATQGKTTVFITGLPVVGEDGDELMPEAVADFAARAGVLKVDELGLPRIKLYRHRAGHERAGQLKGEALVFYAKAESVDLAVSFLDGREFAPGYTVAVCRAQFSAKSVPVDANDHAHTGTAASASADGDIDSAAKRARPAGSATVTDATANNASGAPALVMKRQQKSLAARAQAQALSWGGGGDDATTYNTDSSGSAAEGGAAGAGAGGAGSAGPGPRIISLLNAYSPDVAVASGDAAAYYEGVRARVRALVEAKCGAVAKLTVFPGNFEGPVVIQFRTGHAAAACIRLLNNKVVSTITGNTNDDIIFTDDANTDVRATANSTEGSATGASHGVVAKPLRRLRCVYFDGKTNYKVENENEGEEQRLKAFGDWLESQQDSKSDISTARASATQHPDSSSAPTDSVSQAERASGDGNGNEVHGDDHNDASDDDDAPLDQKAKPPVDSDAALDAALRAIEERAARAASVRADAVAADSDDDI